MSNINSYNYKGLMTELEVRRTNLTTHLSTPSSDSKKTMKEITKINSMLNNMAEYKINYIDEQPAKVEKEPKEAKAASKKKASSSYGIIGMLNK